MNEGVAMNEGDHSIRLVRWWMNWVRRGMRWVGRGLVHRYDGVGRVMAEDLHGIKWKGNVANGRAMWGRRAMSCITA